MTASEFNTEFDVLYNNITSNQAPGLNGYEKSVFLTKAENQILAERFNKNIDAIGRGFDGSEQRQIDFSNITISIALNAQMPSQDYVRIDSRALLFAKPNNCLSVINEVLDVNNTIYTIVALSYTEYVRLMLKPYKYPLKGQAWRLINNDYYEIIGKNVSYMDNPIYKIRYIRKPLPIILEDLSLLDVSIDGLTSVSDYGDDHQGCELDPEIHHEILERAVTLAKMAWQGSTMTQAGMAVEASKR